MIEALGRTAGVLDSALYAAALSYIIDIIFFDLEHIFALLCLHTYKVDIIIFL